MIDTAETIRQALKSVDRKKSNSPYPPELRKRAAAYIRHQRSAGTSWNAIADGLELSLGAAKRWHDNIHNKKPKKDFLPVKMKGDPQGDNGKEPGLVFETPSGYRIEGLSVDDIAALLRLLA